MNNVQDAGLPYRLPRMEKALSRHGHAGKRMTAAKAGACLVLIGASLLLEGYMVMARAEVKPYALASYTHDDNLFRRSDQADPRADNYHRLEAGLDVTAQQARQRLNLRAAAHRTEFERFGFLDNQGGTGHVGWDGEIGRSWQGRAGYDYTRSLASFELLAETEGRNIRTEQRAYAEADYRVFPSLRLRAGVDNADVKNSLESQRVLDFQSAAAAVGIHYLSAAENFIGVQSKLTNGDYPNPENINGTLVDNSFDETENGFVFDWRPGGHSRLQARLGYTDRRYDQLSARDFKGGTGRLIYDWNLTGKTVFNAAAWRELTAADDLSASYVVSRGLTVGPRWAVTPKITVQATVTQERRDYQGDPRVILTGIAERADKLDSLGAAVAYLPLRKIQVAFGYETGERSSTRALTDYRFHSVNGSLRVEF